MGMVPGLRLDTGCSDLLYQINRPRPSMLGGGLTINRLSKWSAAALQVVQIDATRTPGASVRPIAEFLTAQLELDISTVPGERLPSRPSELSEVYEELVDLGLEIAPKGDID
jgi:hypothetical protein